MSDKQYKLPVGEYSYSIAMMLKKQTCLKAWLAGNLEKAVLCI